MSLYQQAEKFVQESFLKSSGKKSKHSERTVFWMKKNYPKADEAMLIAAIAHDIERAFREDKLDGIVNNKKGFLDRNHLKQHQEKGAEIISQFLVSQNVDMNLIERVRSLVSKHEVGGSEEQNALKDADSLSFLENNVDYFIDNLKDMIGEGKVREKITWMFERITSEEAKEIARPWYEDAIKNLKERQVASIY